MIVAKRILIEVGLKVLRGNGMIDAIDTTLDQRPEALNRVYMVDTESVFTLAVTHHTMSVTELLNRVVAGELIGMDGVVSPSRHVIPDDRHDGASFHIFDYRGQDLPLIPVSQPDNGSLTARATPCAFTRPLTADVSLIYFNMPVHRLGFLIHETAYQLEHSPRCLIGNSEFTFKLFSRDTAAGAGHQEHGMKPVAKWGRRFVEYSTSQRTYLITAEVAGVNWLAPYTIMGSYLLALGAVHAVRIATLKDTLKASIIGRILFVELLYRVFCRFHFSLQSQVSNRSIAQNVRDVKGYLRKPNGFLITYAGPYWKHKVMMTLGEHLDYFYDFILMHKGNTPILWPRRIITGYKSLLCYTLKGSKAVPVTNVLGKYDGTGGDKRFHRWGQEANTARYYIDVFSREGDLVVDYFLGAGTFAEVCKGLNRNFIGYEKYKETYDLARARVDGAFGPKEKGRQFAMFIEGVTHSPARE